MKTLEVQRFFDDINEKLFFWAIPESVRPNHFTIVRLILTPVVFYLLSQESYVLGGIIFIIAALTDTIDGALARKRDQITSIGIMGDPIADKLLIGTVLYFIGIEYLIVKLILIAIAIEILGILIMFALSKRTGTIMPANAFGKVKMFLQTSAVTLFFIGVFLNNDRLINFSEILLFGAFGFALIASFDQVKKELGYLFNHK